MSQMLKDNKEKLQEALNLHQTGNLAAAAMLYNKILEEQPDNIDAVFLRGTLYLQSENTNSAIAFLKKAIALKPDYTEAYINLGTAFQKQGKLDEAAGCYNHVLSLEPDYADAFYNLGNIFKRQHKLDKAVENYRQAILINPNDFEAHNNIGTVLREMHKLDDALKHYRQAIELNPDYAVAHFNIGNTYREHGNLIDTAASYRRAIELKPNYAEAHNNLGTVLFESGKYDEAETSYRRAIELKPNYAEALSNLGIVLNELGLPDNAVENCRRAIMLKPDYAKAYNNLGTILFETDEYDEAVINYRRAIRLDPDCIEAHNNLGTVLCESGKYDEAIISFKCAQEINPGCEATFANLADLWERKNSLDNAQSNVEKGLELAPNNPLLNLIAAKLEHRQGLHQDAIKRLEEIEHAGKLNVRIQYFLGKLKDQTGNSREAFDHFTEGNRLCAEQFSRNNVNKDIYLREIDGLIEFSKQDTASSWTANPVPDSNDNPVFLIGFPRSGTTLLDQILDSHPRLQTIEEMPTIESLKHEINNLSNGFPDALKNLTPEQILQLRVKYAQTVSECLQRQSGSILIDKLPLNTTLIPLIWSVFPQAKFILSLRHPCDVCLSCFMQDFKANEAMANFLTIEDTAYLYAKVMGLWRHYEKIMPLTYHKIKYEDLVTDFESETKKILGFLEVEWDDNILRYNDHARKRDRIATPSYQQVTRPIYQHARYRWQRYAEQLDPIMETLKPFIEYFGYSTD